jgi:hypothetical protein
VKVCWIVRVETVAPNRHHEVAVDAFIKVRRLQAKIEEAKKRGDGKQNEQGKKSLSPTTFIPIFFWRRHLFN